VRVVSIEKLGKDFEGRMALEDVNFAMPEGRCMALIGHNGAGKTTLMKLILGLTAPTRGRVEVLGENPARADKALRRQLGFLPENVAFHDELTGDATLAFYARLKGAGLGETATLLERVGLSHAADRRVKTYSKGMRQRLGLAQALLGKPKLLLLDEPTTGLDPVLRQEFYRIIHELTQGGVAVILSSHNLTELEARTDLAVILRDGRLVASGDIDALRKEAAFPVAIRAWGDVGALAERGGSLAPFTLSADRTAVDFQCPPAEKLALLRRLLELGDLCVDVQLRQPSLNELYLHYSGRPISAAETE
jgi:Cu-processing system ATP-binding protein